MTNTTRTLVNITELTLQSTPSKPITHINVSYSPLELITIYPNILYRVDMSNPHHEAIRPLKLDFKLPLNDLTFDIQIKSPNYIPITYNLPHFLLTYVKDEIAIILNTLPIVGTNFTNSDACLIAITNVTNKPIKHPIWDVIRYLPTPNLLELLKALKT